AIIKTALIKTKLKWNNVLIPIHRNTNMSFKENIIKNNLIGMIIYDLSSRYQWSINIPDIEAISNSMPKGSLTKIQDVTFYEIWKNNLEKNNFKVPNEHDVSSQLKRSH